MVMVVMVASAVVVLVVGNGCSGGQEKGGPRGILLAFDCEGIVEVKEVIEGEKEGGREG